MTLPCAICGLSKAHCGLWQQQFLLDGEAVLLGIDGKADFSGLHSRKHDDEA